MTQTYNLLSSIMLLFAIYQGNTRSEKIANDFIQGDEEGSSERNGNTIIYHWNFKDGNNLRSFGLQLNLGTDYNSMQEAFRYLDHAHVYPQKVNNDPYKDVVKSVADFLKQTAENNGLSPVALALSFVQSLPYQSNMGTYQRYASECLVDRRGDCSDTSVLFAAIVAAMNYDCIFLEYPTHLQVGVWSSRDWGTYFLHRNRKYFMCETTGWGFAIGDNPNNEYSEAQITELN